ncbi:hypothetical protein KC347_g225 [Hortaea werneckii]|nr:hypothetical protein KC347_g225 [Hortaea werneckii]
MFKGKSVLNTRILWSIVPLRRTHGRNECQSKAYSVDQVGDEFARMKTYLSAIWLSGMLMYGFLPHLLRSRPNYGPKRHLTVSLISSKERKVGHVEARGLLPRRRAPVHLCRADVSESSSSISLLHHFRYNSDFSHNQT